MKFEADHDDQRTKMLQALIEASKKDKLSPREQKEIQDGIILFKVYSLHPF